MGVFTQWWQSLQNGWNTFTEALRTAWNMLWNWIPQKVTEAFESVKQSVLSGINWVMNQINSLIQHVASIRINIPPPTFGGGGGGGSVGIPPDRRSQPAPAPQPRKPPGMPAPISPIRRLEHGGMMARSGLAIVGEAGPELVALPNGSRVFPTGTTGGLTINFNAPIYGITDFRRAVIEAVRDARRGGGFQDF